METSCHAKEKRRTGTAGYHRHPLRPFPVQPPLPKGPGGVPGAHRIPAQQSCRRKPAPGLLLTGAARYNIDLSRSVMIGDRATDVEAGRRAGCKTALIGMGDADFTGTSLYECVCKILESEVL